MWLPSWVPVPRPQKNLGRKPLVLVQYVSIATGALALDAYLL
jgi:hypothetical protein